MRAIYGARTLLSAPPLVAEKGSTLTLDDLFGPFNYNGSFERFRVRADKSVRAPARIAKPFSDRRREEMHLDL
jgi:hypothetical protein